MSTQASMRTYYLRDIIGIMDVPGAAPSTWHIPIQNEGLVVIEDLSKFDDDGIQILFAALEGSLVAWQWIQISRWWILVFIFQLFHQRDDFEDAADILLLTAPKVKEQVPVHRVSVESSKLRYVQCNSSIIYQ